MKNIFFTAGILLLFKISLDAQEKYKPEDTEVWEPVPEVITPGENDLPPSDAIILFDGKDLSQWTMEDGTNAKWEVNDGFFTIVPGTGNIITRKTFGDCQLHIEWSTMKDSKGKGQWKSNSGIFLMGLYEVQVLDCYNNSTYSNGQTGSIYKQHIPLVNACKPPGQWQKYDIIFKAPVFDEDGSLIKPAYITVIHNGVLIQNHVEIKGETLYIGIPTYNPGPSKMPLMLQDHGCRVNYRNIWIREL